MRTLILAAIFLVAGNAHGQKQVQDTVFLMNGQVVAEKVIDTTIGAVTIYNPKKHSQKIHYEWDQLYMVKFSNGYKRYFYIQDSTINNWFTRDEMWMYMKGENDARKGFRARGCLIGAGITGLLGGMTGTIWGPIAPYTYMALSGIPKIRIRHSTISNPRYVESDAYILGYERVARQRRKLRSLVGGTIGLALGYGFYALFHNSYPETVDIGFNK
jgi:hypothetical protein